MIKFSKIICGTLIFFLMSALCLNAGERYTISLFQIDFDITYENNYTRINSSDALIIYKPGYPELPMVGYKYYLPTDARVVGLKIINATKEKIPGGFDIFPVQTPPEFDSDIMFTPPDAEIYESNEAYPGKAAEFINSGYYRGHHIIDIVVFPFEYIPAERSLYFYSSIEFEFIYDGTSHNTSTRKCFDETTLRTIKGWVQNDFEAPVVSHVPSTAKVSAPIPTDSIPCVIITNQQMESAFWDYALWKTRKGTRTEVMRVDGIGWLYGDSTNSIQDKNTILY